MRPAETRSCSPQPVRHSRSCEQAVQVPFGIRLFGAVEPVSKNPVAAAVRVLDAVVRSEEHTTELQSLMRISYAVFCLKKKNQKTTHTSTRVTTTSMTTQQ